MVGAETIGIVGLGTIAHHHLEALTALPSVSVVGGADIDPARRVAFRGRPVPVYRSPSELLAAQHPSTIIVATPTSSHERICRQVLSSTVRPRRLLVEKPFATSLPAVRALLAGAEGVDEVACLYHAAEAPEVTWAVERLPGWSHEHGSIVGFAMRFADPYRQLDGAVRRNAYGSSWLDSGINALSVALRLVALRGVERLWRLDERTSGYQATVVFDDAARQRHGSVVTTWDVAEPAKGSVFMFESGATLRLDHQAMTARFGAGEREFDEYRYVGPHSRLVAHYRAAFDRVLIQRDGYFRAPQTLLLHELLLTSCTPMDQRAVT